MYTRSSTFAPLVDDLRQACPLNNIPVRQLISVHGQKVSAIGK